LGALHALPDAAQTIDDALAPTQLLTFAMCSLMQDEVLLAFLKELDPATHPIDDLLVVSFYLEFRDYELGRKMSFISEDALRQEIRLLTTSASPSVRMGALALLRPGNWDIPTMEQLYAAVDNMNQMAQECSDCRVTREAFRELLRGCSGQEFAYPQAVDLLIHAPQWNAPMAQLIGEDPVVQAVQEVLASQQTVPAKASGGGPANQRGIFAEALTVTENHPNPEVRNWFIRTLSPSLHGHNGNPDHKTQVKNTLKRIATSSAEKSQQSDLVALDVARAQFILLAEAVDEVNSEEAVPAF
jgi:hypothetical protein